MGLIAITIVLEATRRVLGWVLPAIVVLFLAYGIYAIGFNWSRFVQQLYFDEGIFGIPFFVMTIYVFAFVFFGAFLLKIGVSDYITEFMIALFGKKPGGPAKSAVVSSALMGMVSGSSVANVLTTGTFTIPLMKKTGYPPEIAGGVEPVSSTGGQLMPPIMGAAAFIMAEFLNIPYNRLIIAAVIPALVYYGGVYLFIDLETKRLGLKGMAAEAFKTMSYFIRKLYILLPIVVITVALVWGIPPHISAVSSLGVAIWVAWISRDEIAGNEKLYVVIALLATFLMFTGKNWVMVSTLTLFATFLVLTGLGLVKKGVEFNEKYWITTSFLLFVALTKYLMMTKEQIVLMTGVFGILFSILVGYYSKIDSGKMMYRATYEAMIDAGKTSVSVMLAAAAAGLIQGVLTMTGELTNIGYRLVSLTGGNLWLLLILTMVFSLILGMGVPTTANYIITSLVSAPAIYMLVQNIPPYDQPVPGYTTLIALLAAHFFVFYFGILADVTPPSCPRELRWLCHSGRRLLENGNECGQVRARGLRRTLHLLHPPQDVPHNGAPLERHGNIGGGLLHGGNALRHVPAGDIADRLLRNTPEEMGPRPRWGLRPCWGYVEPGTRWGRLRYLAGPEALWSEVCWDKRDRMSFFFFPLAFLELNRKENQ